MKNDKQHQMNEDEELKNLAPTLAALEKKSLAKAPKDYFEALPGKIQDRIIAEQPRSMWARLSKLIPLKFALPVAAAIALLFFLLPKDVAVSEDGVLFASAFTDEELVDELGDDFIYELEDETFNYVIEQLDAKTNAAFDQIDGTALPGEFMDDLDDSFEILFDDI